MALYQKITRNVRFWDWVNGGWVKITLAPDATLSRRTGGPDREGWWYTAETWAYDRADGTVTYTSFTESRDYDGRIDSYTEFVVPTDELNYRADRPAHPNWRRTEFHQRDYTAEAAGY